MRWAALLILSSALGCGSTKAVEKVEEAECSRMELQDLIAKEVVPAIVTGARSITIASHDLERVLHIIEYLILALLLYVVFRCVLMLVKKGKT